MADEITIDKEVAGVRTGLGGLIDTIKSSAKETEISYGQHRQAVEDNKKSLKELEEAAASTAERLQQIGTETEKAGKDIKKATEADIFGPPIALMTDKAEAAALTFSEKLESLELGGDKWKELDDKLYEGISNPIKDISAAWIGGVETFDEMWAKMPDVSKTLSKGGDAIKELTGGLIDINDIVEKGMTKVKAAFNLVTMPIKLLNDGITSVMGAFGIEIDLLEKGKELLVKGLKKLAGAFFKTAGALIKNAVLFLGRVALFLAGMVFQGLAFLLTLPALLVSAGIFVAGLISTGIAMAAAALPMLAAAAPIIGIALLIGLGVAALVWAGMKLYDMFIENKDFIYAKFNNMWRGVKDVIGTIVGFFTGIWQDISDFIRESFLKIKSWMGLTSEEEEKELEGIKERKAQKEANREAAAQGAEDALANDSVYLAADEATKKQMLKDKEAELFKQMEAQTEFNNMDTQALVDERTAKQEELEGKLAAMVERQEFIDSQVEKDNAEVLAMQQALDEEAQAAFENNRITHNGKVLEGDEKKAFIEEQLADKRAAIESRIKANEEKVVDMKERASLGILRDEEGNMVGGEEFAYIGQDELDSDTDALADEVNMMEGSLEGREDYVPPTDVTEDYGDNVWEGTDQDGTQRRNITSTESLGPFSEWSLEGQASEDFQKLKESFGDDPMAQSRAIMEWARQGRTEGFVDLEPLEKDEASLEQTPPEHAKLLQEDRVNLETETMNREVDEAEASTQQAGNMAVVQNNANTVNTTTRMQDPIAINRRQSSSWGGGASYGDAELDF